MATFSKNGGSPSSAQSISNTEGDTGRVALLDFLNTANLNSHKVVIIGDSIVEQGKPGVAGGEGFITFLEAEYPNIFFINEGIGGDDTTAVIARMASILAHEAQGYIIAIGLNDARYTGDTSITSQNNFISAVQSIVNSCKSGTNYEWSSVLSIWPSYWEDEFCLLRHDATRKRIIAWNKALEASAINTWDIPYVDTFSSLDRIIDLSNCTTLVPDGVHPNPSTSNAKRLYADSILKGSLRKAEYGIQYAATGSEFYLLRILDPGFSVANIQNVKLSPYHKEYFVRSANPSVATDQLMGSYKPAYSGLQPRSDDYPIEIVMSADQLPDSLVTVPNGLGLGIKSYELFRSFDAAAVADPGHPSWYLIEKEYSNDAFALNLLPKKRAGVYYRVSFLDSAGTDGTGGTTGTYVKVKKIWGGVAPVRYSYANMLNNGATSERFDLFFSDDGGSASAYMANEANVYPLHVMFESPHELVTLALASVGEANRDIDNWEIHKSYDPACLTDPAHASWVSVVSGTGDTVASI